MKIKAIFTTPSNDEIYLAQNWNKIGKKGKAIGRQHILIIEKEARNSKKGPVYTSQDLPPGTEYIATNRIKSVTSYTETIEKSITNSIASQLSKDVISKLGGGFTVGVNLTASLKSELQNKITKSLTKSVSDTLKETSSYSIEIEKERVNSVKFLVPNLSNINKSVTQTTYFKLREYVWEIYLIQSDFLHLEYEKHVIKWLDVRKTISKYELEMHMPLFKLIFYVPENQFSYTSEKYTPEIKDEQQVKVAALKTHFPLIQQYDYKPLEDLAKITFPIGKDQRKISQQTIRHVVKKGAKKGAKKAAPKKAASKKASPKKAARKK